MDADEIRRRKRLIEEEFGAWTAANIRLGPGVATRPAERESQSERGKTASPLYHETVDSTACSPPEARMARVVQIVSDLSQRPLNALRILDLACLEGHFAIELAAGGARVVAVDGREANIAKANFARDVLGLTNVEFRIGDVREVTESSYGRFDVVLCLGILYHLDVPDIFSFLDNITAMCDHLLVLDTELSRLPRASASHDGVTYWGCKGRDHLPSATAEERRQNVWMSIDNTDTFLLTRFSMYNLLRHLGFTSAYECFLPAVIGHGARTTFVAVKGTPVKLQTSLNHPQECYAEIGSSARDSELHLLHRDYARLRNHPLIRFALALRRLVRGQ